MGRPRKVRPEEVSETNNDNTGDHDNDTSTATLDAPSAHPPAVRQKFIPGEPSQPTTDLRTEIGGGEIVVSTKKYRDPTGANLWNTIVYSGDVSSAKITGNWFTIGEAERHHAAIVADETAAYESRLTALKAHGLI